MAVVVTNSGKAIITNRLKGAGTEPLFIGWGTGAGTAAVADTALFTPAAEARTSGTSTQQTTTVTNDTYRVVGTLTSLSAQSITNAGLLDAASAGNMFLHADHGSTPLAISDSIQYTINVQFV
jgi:hypothetical protein